MTRILLATTLTLGLAVAALVGYIAWDDAGEAQANSPIDCEVVTDTTTEPPTITATCVGEITVETPLGDQVFTFELVVKAIDNEPDGPSFGDVIISCTLDTGTGPEPISIGPCP
jgi:hypothetical protein